MNCVRLDTLSTCALFCANWAQNCLLKNDHFIKTKFKSLEALAISIARVRSVVFEMLQLQLLIMMCDYHLVVTVDERCELALVWMASSIHKKVLIKTKLIWNVVIKKLIAKRQKKKFRHDSMKMDDDLNLRFWIVAALTRAHVGTFSINSYTQATISMKQIACCVHNMLCYAHCKLDAQILYGYCEVWIIVALADIQ